MSSRPDDLFIAVNGNVLTGWTSFTLTRSCQAVPSSLTIEYAEKYLGQQQMEVGTNDKIIAYLGETRVMTGYVDRVQPSISVGSHSVTMHARSKVRDLVDCSADLLSFQNQIINGNIQTIAEQICKPFHINVINKSTQELKTMPAMMASLGETGWSILERVARYQAVLLYDDVYGNLVISDIGATSMASGIRQGVNAMDYTSQFSTDQRYSDYFVVWGSLDSMKGYGGDGPVHGHATDPELISRGIYRPLYLLSEQTQGGQDIAQARAQWEANVRLGRGYSLRVQVDDWRDSAETLWQPNSLIDISLPSIKLGSQRWAIVSVSYQKSLESGTTAELEIMPAAALEPEPIAMNSITAGYSTNSEPGTPTPAPKSSGFESSTAT